MTSRYRHTRSGWAALGIPPALTAVGMFVLLVVMPMQPACQASECCVPVAGTNQTCCAHVSAPCTSTDAGLLVLLVAAISAPFTVLFWWSRRYLPLSGVQ